MKKINEIFYSIQGEGSYAGCAATFVRFSNCNLKCPFCDEYHLTGIMMSDNEIVDRIKRVSVAKLVVLTGGEPSLFVDEQFVELLHANGYFVCMETNGTHEVVNKIDFVTMSPKEEYCSTAKTILRRCNDLKVVYDGKNDMTRYDGIEADHYFIQPLDTGDFEQNKQIYLRCVAFVKKNPKWRISIQMHKILNVQ